MEQCANYAAAKDAQTTSSREEYARSMGQRSRSDDAVSMDALIEPCEKEYAQGMGHITILTTNLLHLLLHVNQHSMKRQQLLPIIILKRLLQAKIKVVEILLV